MIDDLKNPFLLKGLIVIFVFPLISGMLFWIVTAPIEALIAALKPTGTVKSLLLITELIMMIMFGIGGGIWVCSKMWPRKNQKDIND